MKLIEQKPKSDASGDQIASGSVIEIINKSKNLTIKANCVLTERQKDIILAGGLLNYTMSK